MSKKRLILSSSQLDEICGGIPSYLDGTQYHPQTEIYSLGNPTTDNVSVEQPFNGPVAKRFGRYMTTPGTLEEINSNIQGKVFGGGTENENKECKRSPNATAMAKSRLLKALKQLKTSQNPLEKKRAFKTIKRMEKNAPNLEIQINQFNAAVENDENIRKAKADAGGAESGENNRILAQHTKKPGNGGAHSKKTQNGNITYFE